MKVQGERINPGCINLKRTNAHFNRSSILTHVELRPCEFRKVRHRTRGDAEKALKARLTTVETRQFAVARCPSCNYFHLEVAGGVGPMPDFSMVPAERPLLNQRPSGWKLELPPVSQCPRAKRRYYIVEDAKAEIEKMKTWGIHQPEKGDLHVYACEVCEAFHIGHRMADVVL